MQTERESTQAGWNTFNHTDASGRTWKVEATWSAVAGRVVCTRLVIDSDASAAVTSAVVRDVEKAVRELRVKRLGAVRRMAQSEGDVARRASKQVAAYQRQQVARPGRPQEHDVWLKRAQAMREAWAQRQPMLAALKAAEPGWSESTYRTWPRRAREWDRRTGSGLLDGVGRAKREDTA
jgi:hypothetical protein